jgi:hypothetical protein
MYASVDAPALAGRTHGSVTANTAAHACVHANAASAPARTLGKALATIMGDIVTE